MSDNAQKTPFAKTQNEFAQKKIGDALQITGKSLPATIVSVSGWIVTVAFEIDSPFTLPNVTVPVASSLYDYLPLKKGDPGVVRAADARLGGLSGLGGGLAKLSLAANLSALVFEPFGKVAYEAPNDPAMRVVQGPNGVIVQTLDGATKIEVTKTTITLTRGTKTVVMDDAAVTFNCDVVVNGKFTSTDATSLGGGAQPVKLADGSNAVNVKGT